MAYKNFSYSTVATAPSPASSGTSLVVATSDGAKLPPTPFNATVWPVNTQPTQANAEVIRVTGISTDTLTIVRAQEGSSARSIGVGDQIAATITAQTLATDIVKTTASSGSALTIDVTLGNVQDITLSANCTFTLSGAVSGSTFDLTLILRQDATGSRTVTWPGSVTWLGTGTAPTLQTAAAAVDSVVLYTVDGGTTWFGVAQTSASGLRSGSSFPGSPSDGDLFYRSDRNILYFYKSSVTSWLSVDRKYIPFTQPRMLNSTGTTGITGWLPVFEDMYVESVLAMFHLGATNNGSNFWTATFTKGAPNETGTTLGTVNTSGDSVNTNANHISSIGAVLLAASFPEMHSSITKTGTPSTPDWAFTAVVRSVG